MRKRLLVIVATMAMVVAMMPAMAFGATTVATLAELQTELAGSETEIIVVGTIEIPAGTDVTIDLKGKTVVGEPGGTAAYAVINNKGNLTITDTVGGGKILCDNKVSDSTSFAVNTIVNSGKLTITAGTIENKAFGGSQIGYAIDNNSTTADAILTINGGKVTASGSGYYDGIRQFCNSTTNENSVTINGGEVSSIWMQNPSDGSTERNTKETKGSITINNGTVTALYLEPSTNFEAAITGGNVGSVSAFETAQGRDLEGFISGGTVGRMADSFLAEDAKWDPTTGKVTPPPATGGQATTPEKSPATGDNSMAPFAVAGLVMAAMAAVVATRRRTN